MRIGQSVKTAKTAWGIEVSGGRGSCRAVVPRCKARQEPLRLELLRSLLAFRSPVARFINHANIPPKSIKEEATHGRGGTPLIAPARALRLESMAQEKSDGQALSPRGGAAVRTCVRLILGRPICPDRSWWALISEAQICLVPA